MKLPGVEKFSASAVSAIQKAFLGGGRTISIDILGHDIGMWSGLDHKAAFRSIAQKLDVRYNTVSSRCTRALDLKTDEFIRQVKSKSIKAVAMDYILDIKATKTHWIITWNLKESENYNRFGMEDGRGWMARLVPVLDELLRGDLRSLYIGWLAAVAGEMMDDDEMEPLCVSGLAT